MRSIEQIISRQVNRWNSITQMLRYEPGHADQSDRALEVEAGQRHPVICLSRDLGSGARVIAQAVCDRLGYEMFGTAIIDEIAKDMNLQRHLIDAMDECFRSELDVMVHSYLEGHEVDSQEYLSSLVRVVQAVALRGGVVLLGRGTPYILGSRSGLNVLVVAPPEVRVQRLMQYEGCDEQTARELIKLHDEHRRKFLYKMFHKDGHDPSQFDLVINTGRIQPAQAAQMVLAALEARGHDLTQMTIPPQSR